jgi:serine protease Do
VNLAMNRPAAPFPFVSLCAVLLGGAACAQGGELTPGAPPQPGGGLAARGSTLQVVEADAGERELRMTPVVRAVQKAADSVVSIYLQHQLAEHREAVTEGQGSGVLLDERGLAITNWHVVAPVVLAGRAGSGLDVMVKLRDGRSRPAQVLTSSPRRDLALLQLKLEADERVKPIEIGRSADLMVGETVIAIGNPQGHANTVTDGVLSAIDRSIRVRAPDGQVREYTGLLQTDAAINQGNSGGALLDITGRLIGINNAMAMGAENIGFAIPMDTVREEFEKELIQSTSFAAAADAPWLGIEVAERDGAVVIAEVLPGSPAADVGIQVGDVLASIAGEAVSRPLDYVRRFLAAAPDQPLPLLLKRNGRELPLRPVPRTRDHRTISLLAGVSFEAVSSAADTELVTAVTRAIYANSGRRRVQLLPSVLRVARVDAEGPAADLGLKVGDVLMGVMMQNMWGQQLVPVPVERDLARLLEQRQGSAVRIAVLRGDDELDGPLELRRLRR